MQDITPDVEFSKTKKIQGKKYKHNRKFDEKAIEDHSFENVWSSEGKILQREAVVQSCSVKKMFIEITQIHRKTPVPKTLL